MENSKHPAPEDKQQKDEIQDELMNLSLNSSFEPKSLHSDTEGESSNIEEINHDNLEHEDKNKMLKVSEEPKEDFIDSQVAQGDSEIIEERNDKTDIDRENPVHVINKDELVEEINTETNKQEEEEGKKAVVPVAEELKEDAGEQEGNEKCGEKQVIAEESGEKQVDAEESREKQVIAEESGEKQVDAEESREKQVDAEESREKQVDAEESREKQVDAEASGEKQVDAEESREKQVDAEASGKEQEDSEESEGEEEGEEELFEKYNKLSREELVEVLEILVKEEDVNQIRSHIGYIKAAFRKLLKDESLADYENRMQREGEQEEEVEAIVDVLSERYEQALLVYKDKKFVFDQALEQQKQENLVAKEKILEELRNLIESEEELKKTYDQFRELQDQWRQIGAVPQGSKNTLWNNYHFLVEKFFDKVKINKELKDLDLKKNLEAKTELCEKAEELLLESSITKSFQQLQKLHEAWKETGPVPKDKKDEIWERFKSATEKLNKRRQDYYDTLREEQNKNYAAKLILCEEAEHLTAVSPESPKQWQQYTNQVNELFKMWKTIGFAPKKANNEVWNRFRSSLDTFYKNKKEFFSKYKEHQTENYNQKLNLCLQAEALKDNEDWRSTTEELIGLQKEWKKIGPVPAKFSDKIWKRFRAACDEFFNNKSEHFANIGEKQDENLKKKLALIDNVIDHKYTDDNNHNLKVLKDYQREWMEIGHVPIKQKDKVQTAFRKAVDEQFDRLNISKKVKSTLNYRSKLDNLKNAPNADNLIYKERNFIINKIATIQSDIKIWENNIGFFASSKKADILKAEFEEKIEKGRQEILILEEKLKILRES